MADTETKPRERGLIFTGWKAAYVASVPAGTLVQTRRVMNPQPEPLPPNYQRISPYDDSGYQWACSKAKSMISLYDAPCAGPYGWKGDRIWSREAWRTSLQLNDCNAADIARKCDEANYDGPWCPVEYLADGKVRDWDPGWGMPGRTRQGRFMPRWLSRALFELVEVRVQRVSEISEEDAKAEGMEELPGGFFTFNGGLYQARSARDAFAAAWEGIHGPGSFAAGARVWALTLRRLGEEERGG